MSDIVGAIFGAICLLGLIIFFGIEAEKERKAYNRFRAELLDALKSIAKSLEKE